MNELRRPQVGIEGEVGGWILREKRDLTVEQHQGCAHYAPIQPSPFASLCFIHSNPSLLLSPIQLNYVFNLSFPLYLLIEKLCTSFLLFKNLDTLSHAKQKQTISNCHHTLHITEVENFILIEKRYQQCLCMHFI